MRKVLRIQRKQKLFLRLLFQWLCQSEIRWQKFLVSATRHFFPKIDFLNPAGASISAASVLPVNFIPSCVEGRFYVPVSLTNLAAGSYSITLAFELISETGQVFMPPFKTVSATYFYRPQ